MRLFISRLNLCVNRIPRIPGNIISNYYIIRIHNQINQHVRRSTNLDPQVNNDQEKRKGNWRSLQVKLEDYRFWWIWNSLQVQAPRYQSNQSMQINS